MDNVAISSRSLLEQLCSRDAYAEGVTSHSPASRSACWVDETRILCTLKAFHPYALNGQPMSQSLSQIYLHLVFSTKNRLPFLTDKSIRSDVQAYLRGACEGQKSPSLITGGVEDHVHILCRLGKTTDPSTLIREIKRESSKWIKQQSRGLGDFHWQSGYGAFSVSPSHVEPLKEYIAQQEEHHRQESFQDEFRRLCHKYGVSLDEQYAWD